MIDIKSIIKHFLWLFLITLIIGGLFIIFKDFSFAILILKFFVFPGAVFIFLGSLFIDWYDRKLFALMQDRIGPPFLQPLYDLLKLLVKEDITPDGADKIEFDAIPPIQMILALLVAFTVPVYSIEGLISFEGDVIFILFLAILIGASIFLLGWTSNSPYSMIGGSRAALAEVSFGIPLTLAFIGPAILSGSLSLSTIILSDYNLVNLPLEVIHGDFELVKIFYLLPLVILFVLALLSVTAVLEKVPFDPAHAEVEIVGGWNVELSGKKLLFTRFANLILEFALAGIVVAIFLGGPRFPLIDISGIWIIGNWDVLVYLLSIATFIVKMLIVVFFITFIRSVQSRVRIDQLIHYFWYYFLPLAFVALFMIIIFLGVGI